MKKLSILFISALFSIGLFGQKANNIWAEKVANDSRNGVFMYNFSVSTEPYNELSGSSSLSQGQVWDDPTWVVPIGFNFNMMNVTAGFLTFEVSEGGVIGLFNPASPIMAGVIAAFDADLLDRGADQGGTSTVGLSPVSYKLDGTAPYRIFKLEWKNAGSYNQLWDNNSMSDYVNFQVWLYETGRIEFRFGPNSITNTSNWYDGANGIISGLAVIDLGSGITSNIHLLMGNAS